MAQINRDIALAKLLLAEGELVAIPTETVYGLAANAADTLAVAKIFEAKNRPSFDPLIVHLHNKSQLNDLCKNIPDVFHKLYDAFCPGPITFILPKKKSVADLVTAGHPSVGIRFPRHPLTRELLFESRLPLAAPSANPFGYVSPTSAQHVQNQLGDKIPLILDGGPSTIGIESTIIDLSSNKVKILRLGGLAIEEIEAITGPLEVKTSSSNPNAPGMLSSHYSPGKKLIIGEIDELIKEYGTQGIASITLSKTVEGIDPFLQKTLSPSEDLLEAASKLFASLRDLDRPEVKMIIAEKFPKHGLGLAINDRLKRASVKASSR